MASSFADSNASFNQTQAIALDELHPSLWRASQLARAHGEYQECGYRALATHLPGGGWPLGGLIELLVEHAGSAELQLLRPALAGLTQKTIALLQTPYQPHHLALRAMGLDPRYLLWLRSEHQSDAQWAAEQILLKGGYGALLFWAHPCQHAHLRRLHLAAQHSQTLFCVIRPEHCAQQASPALLRIQLARVPQGLRLSILKRRGTPHQENILISQLAPAMFTRLYSDQHENLYPHDHAFMDGHSSTSTRARHFPSLLSR